MSSPSAPSRRQLLKLLGCAPLLPLAGGSLAVLGGCTGDTPVTPRTPIANAALSAMRSVRFTAAAAPGPDAPAAMAGMTTGSTMVVTYENGVQQPYALSYTPFFVTGDQVPDGRGGTILAGGGYDAQRQPLCDLDGTLSFSKNPDGASLLTLPDASVPGVRGNPVFAVVQFEETVAAMAVLTLDQDPATGQLSLVRYADVDLTPVHGLWTTCGASLTPWGTHLSSEEYLPDATIADPYLAAFSKRYYGADGRANPYHYGYTPEITVRADGTGHAVKHYCMGRISHELAQIMPDQRTALMGNDATNGGLFMFVADRPADLSSGTLYVAQWHQTSGTGPGSAKLSWIRLGHASDAEVRALADSLSARDIVEVRSADPGDPAFARVPFNGKRSWVRVLPGREQAAAFLETARYAAIRGGSMGFTKMEGTTVNARDRIAYLAMSYVQSSMLAGHPANAGDIAVEGPTSGAVYALNLADGQHDQDGQAINSDWVPVDMAAVPALIGRDLPQADALGNTSDPERIANPDNLKFSERLRTLFIGEDSDRHVNNFLWAYQVDTRELTRILSVPVGAESTGLHAVDDIHGWTYVMSNFQHAGDWPAPEPARAAVEALIEANYRGGRGAAVGYLSGAPVRV